MLPEGGAGRFVSGFVPAKVELDGFFLPQLNQVLGLVGDFMLPLVWQPVRPAAKLTAATNVTTRERLLRMVDTSFPKTTGKRTPPDRPTNAARLLSTNSAAGLPYNQ